MASTLTVSQLCRYLSMTLKQDARLRGIAVMGEISNLSAHYKSGHIYFSIRDDSASVRAVMFASNVERLRFMPENGMKVIALGNIEFYERDGQLQIICTDLAQTGEGSIHASVERTKKKLEAMGVFSESAKKKLPKSPNTIGVVTSPGGAVIQDIINVVKRRYPGAKIKISPATVQGGQAEESVCKAIKRIDDADCDVVILARGGGSADDLMPFNSEKITMAVHNCKTPIISAVGHETDTTLSDYAADMRAPTPSAAAEIAVPETKMLGSDIEALQKAMHNVMNVKLANMKSGIISLSGRLISASPGRMIESKQSDLQSMNDRLRLLMESSVDAAENSLREEYSRLDALNPLAVLSRGYAIVTDDSGKTVKSGSVKKSDTVNIRMRDIKMTAEVLSVEDINEV